MFDAACSKTYVFTENTLFTIGSSIHITPLDPPSDGVRTLETLLQDLCSCYCFEKYLFAFRSTNKVETFFDASARFQSVGRKWSRKLGFPIVSFDVQAEAI